MPLQARSSARVAFDRALGRSLNRFDFIVDSQVTLTVHWYGVPRVRWQTDRYPDLDNWLKPLIDSFVGADSTTCRRLADPLGGSDVARGDGGPLKDLRET